MLTFRPMENLVKSSNIPVRKILKDNNISSSVYENIISGRTVPTAATLDKFCKLLNARVDQLVMWVPDDIVDHKKEYNDHDVSTDKMFALMAERSITMYKAAADIGLGINTLGRIKHGMKPKYDTIKKMAEYLSVKPTDLYELKSSTSYELKDSTKE